MEFPAYLTQPQSITKLENSRVFIENKFGCENWRFGSNFGLKTWNPTVQFTINDKNESKPLLRTGMSNIKGFEIFEIFDFLGEHV